MEFTIMDQNFNKVHVLDTYKSMIWVDKYQEPGTFELYLPISDAHLKYIKAGNYICSSVSEHVMIIEDISYESDAEEGLNIKAVGRSLESILDRRIVWAQTDFNNVAIDTAIAKLLNEAIISPSISDRKISNFAAYTNSTDTNITKLKVNHQYTGDNLLSVIEDLCVEFGIGFKIILNDNYQFVFSFYNGVNRSYYQTANPYVVFSPEFDNITNSTYTEKSSSIKNVTLVGGDGEGKDRKYKTVGAEKGLERRELFTDARDIQKDELTNSKYMALLEKRGVTKLDENNGRTEFDSKCDTTRLYVYDTDFKIGDIVQIVNEFTIEVAARITEFTWSLSNSEIETYPTFSVMKETIISGKNELATTLANLRDLNTSGEWTDNIWTNANTTNHIVLTVNTDRYERVVGITVDGKNGTNSAITFNLGRVISDNTDLVLSGCTGGSSSTYKLSLYDSTANTERTVNYDSDSPVSGYVPSHVNYVRFTLAASKSVNNITLYPMIRDVDQTSAFEPFDEALHTS